MIYLAPIQGFTDFVYRKAHSSIFTDVDAYFIPYISVKNNQIINKYKKEVLPVNNPQKVVIPQILAKDTDELLFLSKTLGDLGYKEINLNLGCPYPMVTNRIKGAGLLPHPEKIRVILSYFFEKEDIKLSIKLRAGLLSPKEIETIIPVLNDFPLTEIIFHPRIAKQLYAGTINDTAFRFATKNLKHKLVYNGDIFSLADYNKLKQQYQNTDTWMLGRGVLMNPFLPSEIKQVSISEDKRIVKLMEFHSLILEGYLENMDNEGNVLNKLKQFWEYFSFNFTNQKKALRNIKKTKNLNEYRNQIRMVFLHLI